MPVKFPLRLRPLALLLAGLGVLGLAGWSGCSAVSDDELFKTAEVNLSPMAALVPANRVMDNAFTYIDQHHGCFVVPVESDDMLPRYPKGTALIVYPTGFETLKRGMTVVYTKPGGVRVAHVLTLKTADGWAARGFNAKDDDIESVTTGNYLGTVTMAFAPSAEETN